MDAGLYGLISNFKLTSRKLRISDSDGSDRLNHFYVPLILAIFSLVICTKSYLVGEPLQCWIPQYYQGSWEQYAENYCWVENTEFVKHNVSLRQEKLSEEIKYYQWVPFVLLIQALMFYLPHYFWRMINWMSGVDMHHLMVTACNVTALNKEEAEQGNDHFVNMYRDSFMEYTKSGYVPRRGNFLCISYVITKFLYILNIYLQFILTSAFIKTNFFTFGASIISGFYNDIYWSKTGLFPRVTFCKFMIRTLDQTQPHTIQCVLVVNMIIEKCYIGIWMIFVFCFIVNLFSFFRWIIWMFCGMRPNKEYEPMARTYNLNVWKYMSRDSIFVLKLLRNNCLGMGYIRFLEKFGEVKYIKIH